MKRAILMLVAVCALSCGGGHHPPPQPPQPPPEPTPTPVCVPPDLVTECWHKPPGEDWQFIPAPVDPTPEPPPPGPSGCAPASEDPGWGDPVSPAARPPQMVALVKRATDALGDRCGMDPMQNLRDLGAEIMRQNPGVCADGGNGADALAVLAPDGLWEEYHAVSFAAGSRGCWTESGRGKYKNAWPFNGSTPPPPPGPEPEPSACGEPVPPPLMRWQLGWHNEVFANATPMVRGREFCKSIGLTDIGTDIGRLFCPPRAEGHPERVACEKLIVGGFAAWKWEPKQPGDVCGNWQGNPLVFVCKRPGAGKVRPKWVEVCDVAGGVCKRIEQ